ncbi:MAG: hypothetical protein ACKVPX_06240 [Myxococcaceae bacterium]
MTSLRNEGWRALVFLGAASGLLAALFWVAPRWLGTAGGADVALTAALKATEPEGLSLNMGEGAPPLVSTRHAFSRVTLPALDAPAPLRLVATLDFTGKWGSVTVSSLGREEVPLEKHEDAWNPSHGWAPRLVRAVTLLEARRRALETGDWPALLQLASGTDETLLRQNGDLMRVLRLSERRYRVASWHLRFERDEVLVSERYHLQGTLPDVPVDEHGTVRLVMTARGDEFLFSPPLM